MKIGYLVSQYPAVSHTFVRREVEALRRLGLDVETFSIRPGEALSESDRAERSRTFTVLEGSPASLVRALAVTLLRSPRRWLAALVGAAGHRLPGGAALLRSGLYFAEAMRLSLELERRRVTHLHNHFANPAAQVGLAAAGYLGIGWSVSVHGLSDFSGPTTPLLPGKVAAARFVVSATEWGLDQLRRIAPRDAWHKLHVVRCGVDLDRLSPPRPPRQAARTVEILSVGRLAPEKGHLGLIEAFARLRRAGVDARLVLIGGGPEESRIREAIGRLQVGDRVALAGPQPEEQVFRAMAAADVFALSSLMEGLPVVLMEAMALELPVVAPAITGIPELVSDGETGLLYPAGRWDELAAKLGLLASDPLLRARLGAAGRARVRGTCDVALSAARLARLFEEAHAGAAPRPADGPSSRAPTGPGQVGGG